MDLTQLKVSQKERLVEANLKEELSVSTNIKTDNSQECSVSLEAEIPEVLYRSMKEFIGMNPQWDQYSLMSSALANFLFQNGSENRAVTEKYLNDLFTLPDS